MSEIKMYDGNEKEINCSDENYLNRPEYRY